MSQVLIFHFNLYSQLAVDNTEKQREHSPSFEAVYIVHPNRYNIDTIIQDFIDPQNKRYAAAHIFFISSVDNRTISKIRNSPIRPIIKSLFELNMDFNPIESMLFTTRTPESFQVLYNASCRALLDSELALISKKVCVLGDVVLMIACFIVCFTWRESYYSIS